MGAFVTACGTATPTGAPTIIATTSRPLSLAPVFALMRPPGVIVGAVPSTVELPPRPPVSLRVTTTVDGAVDLIRRGQATAAIVPRGSATGITGWKLANGVEVPPVSPATFASPGPIRLVVRRDSVGGPRLASGRLAPRDRPFRFAYLPTPWGLPIDALVGEVIPRFVRAVTGSSDFDGLPFIDGGRWEAFATENEAVNALVDDRADAAALWPEGAAYALRNPAFALAATLEPTGRWAEAATPVIVGTVPPAVEAWITALGSALDGPHAVALLRAALPERDPLTLAGAAALRHADWTPPSA